MKTFKVAEFFLEKEEISHKIPLKDGLIINREDEKQSWLIELFLDESEELSIRRFHHISSLTARIAITDRGNDPAIFSVSMRGIQKLDHGISVLFDAQLRQRRNHYTKQVLDSLLKQGLEGEELLNTFTDTIRKRPEIPEK
ncbi:YwpF family protein [Domibacillus aminovorans]|uniref:YwpF-like protein n=1 Tax=Domibacillus aminovorans TaxID=29332 RepID=A0A177L0Y7_9BACI|nr:YwpF family protein [Domibacillus aminovorans]OAH58915.1 hypothetical protein AWH49_04410 [Domibacillus aminovorans]